MSHRTPQDTTLAVDGPGYPARLRDLPDPPPALFVRGCRVDAGRPPPDRPLPLGLLGGDAPSVAVVGTRAASGHSMALARELSRDLAREGVVVISGGAVGIDSAAHRGALDAGGTTVAVLASGLDAPYPARNRPLYADICAAVGALVSPYGPGTPIRRHQFVRRNRIVAALADAVVVIDCGMSSGALYTAAAARRLGRVLCAAPGTPGCESLIAQGAAVVECAADVRAALAGRPRRPDAQLPELGSEEALVLEALESEVGRREGELAERTGLGARSVARALMGLELEGLALVLPGNAYVRSTIAQELLAS